MTVDEQIAQMTDPQEFTRLCNIILTELHGPDYQVIDGTRADGGNDGYIISEKRIIAMYCPIKPERKTDADYLRKIKSDIDKAQSLRDSEKYVIENWTFLSPRKLSNNVVVEMMAYAKSRGFSAIHQESTFLSCALLRHKHLVESFPSLHINDVDAKLEEIRVLLKTPNLQEQKADEQLNSEGIYTGAADDIEGMDRVLEIRVAQKTVHTKPTLRSIYYQTADSAVQLNALLGLLDFYDPVEDTVEDIVQLCNEGTAIAEQLGASSVKAHILAQKGYVISFSYSTLDMRTAFQMMADNAIGFQTITEEYRQGVIVRLKDLETQFDAAFGEALRLTKDRNDYSAMAGVLVFIGNAAGLRAMYMQALNVPDRAASERAACRRALLTAKRVSNAIGDDIGAANALFNLANQIRFFGETAEAMGLVKSAIEAATRFNNQRLLQKANVLLHTIETGRIPDYMAGERRYQ
ncbi:MAG: hypothetical protein ABIE70_11980 [bacterium]